MAAQQPARASPELRVAPLSPRYRRNYTTPGGTTGRGWWRGRVTGHSVHCIASLQRATGLIWCLAADSGQCKVGLNPPYFRATDPTLEPLARLHQPKIQQLLRVPLELSGIMPAEIVNIEG